LHVKLLLGPLNSTIRISKDKFQQKVPKYQLGLSKTTIEIYPTIS